MKPKLAIVEGNKPKMYRIAKLNNTFTVSLMTKTRTQSVIGAVTNYKHVVKMIETHSKGSITKIIDWDLFYENMLKNNFTEKNVKVSGKT